MKYEIHPACAIHPEMTDAEKDSLLRDMQESGFKPHHPILVQGGKIVDGRHRYLIARKLGIEPCVIELPPSADPWRESWSSNENRRRGMSAAQRAVAHARMIEGSERYAELKAEAAERKERKPVSAGLPPQNRETVDTQLAREVGVSPRTYSGARKLVEKRPDLAERVLKGEMGVEKAEREISRKDPARTGPARKRRGRDPLDVAASILTDRCDFRDMHQSYIDHRDTSSSEAIQNFREAIDLVIRNAMQLKKETKK